MSNFILNPICIQLSNPIDIRVALQELKQLLTSYSFWYLVRFHLKINWNELMLPNSCISHTPKLGISDVGLLNTVFIWISISFFWNMMQFSRETMKMVVESKIFI